MSSKKPSQKVQEKSKPATKTASKPVQFFPPQANPKPVDNPTTFYQPLSKAQAKEKKEKEKEKVVVEKVVFHSPQALHEEKPLIAAAVFHPPQTTDVEQMRTSILLKPMGENIINENELQANAANRSWFYANEITSIYNFPKPDPLRKVVVGIISFGGGLYGNLSYNGNGTNIGVLTNGDVQSYWTKIGIPVIQQPKVVVAPLFGASNSPTLSGTDENTLDVEMVGAACPSSNLTIILYIVPNSLSNFQKVVNHAITTPVLVNGTFLSPTILSISWAASELYNYGSLETTLSLAVSKGINIFVAAGDNGSTDSSGNTSTCNYPSSSPNVISCGGTSLVCPSGKYSDKTTREITWSGSGGGISKIYAKPFYQNGLIGTKRQIPDISLNADPNTGIAVCFNKQYVVYGGTSFVAPLMAGFLATINVTKFINPLLYPADNICFHDVLSGNNGTYQAKVGYDSCTGLGSINGVALAQALTSTSVSKPVSRVSGIIMSSNKNVIPMTHTQQLNVNIYPDDATDKSVIWSSSDHNVATVSENGVVTAVSIGNVTITGKTNDGGLSTSTVITVVPLSVDVSSIIIDPITITLDVNQEYQVNATVLPSSATDKSVIWTSSDSSIAIVSENGNIKGLSQGTAVITVTSINNVSSFITVNVTIPVEAIFITPSVITCVIEDTYQIEAELLPNNATDKKITWSSSNPSVADVSEGLVSAHSVGTTIITAASKNNTATLKVCVIRRVVDVLIDSFVTIQPQQTYQITPTILPLDATIHTTIWTSSDTSIVDVSENGLLSALSVGKATVTLTVTDGISIHVSASSITVAIPVSDISIEQNNVTCNLNDVYQINPVILPSSATDKSMIWSSSDISVLTVSPTGLVKCIKDGTSTVTVTSKSSLEKQTTVLFTVMPAISVVNVSLNAKAMGVLIHNTYQAISSIVPSNATYKTLTWSSSDDKIVSVSPSGMITALSDGKAVITVTSVNGKSASIIVTTIIPVVSVSISNPYISLQPKQSCPIIATVFPENARNKTVKWTSSNSSIVSVTQTGFITALSVGNAVITVTTLDGSKTSSCNVFVKSNGTIAVTSVSPLPSSVTVEMNRTIQLTSSVLPSSATNKNITWVSSDTKIAKVLNGLVTGVKDGTCLITAISVDGSYSSTTTITVTQPAIFNQNAKMTPQSSAFKTMRARNRF